MSWRGWLLASTLLVLLLAGMWWLTAPHPLALPSHAEVAALQGRADAACRCSRTGSYDRCWADYRREIGRFEHSESGTMCAEESVTLDCFLHGMSDDPPCITTGRPYGACSDAEMRERVAAARRRNVSGCQD